MISSDGRGQRFQHVGSGLDKSRHRRVQALRNGVTLEPIRGVHGQAGLAVDGGVADVGVPFGVVFFFEKDASRII